MRWLFLFVLSLNLAYIAWQMSLSSADTASGIQSIKGVPPIMLLSEVDRLQTADMASDRPALDQPALADEILPTQKNSVTPDVTDADVAAPAQPEVASEVRQSGDSDNEGSRAKSQQLAVAAVADEPEAIGPVVDDEVEQRCYTLGPFRDLDVLRGLTREIREYTVTTDFRGREVKEQSLYWVYIRPQANRKKAVAMGKRLKASSIKDYYVIRDGEQVNGISLGYFRNKDGANSLVKKVKKLGYDVVLEPVFKTYTVYWLDYQMAGDKAIPQAVLDKYMEAAKKDKVTRLVRNCAV